MCFGKENNSKVVYNMNSIIYLVSYTTYIMVING